MPTRPDETWHRLREWTNGQAPSERLAHQILMHEGFQEIDPSHPLGGKDGGKDALCQKDGITYHVAVYFPRGQQTWNSIKKKFKQDSEANTSDNIRGFIFVTNQEITLAKRKELTSLNEALTIKTYHLERIASILDEPSMYPIRRQFLQIGDDTPQVFMAMGGEGGQAPGAGGGGGGSIGPRAVGGQGGKGGNTYYVINPQLGLPSMDIDTPFEEWMYRYIPVTPFLESIRDLWISSAFFANYAEINGGLVSTIGAGWNTYSLSTLLGQVSGCFVFIAEFANTDSPIEHTLVFELINQNEIVITENEIIIVTDKACQVPRVTKIIYFNFSVNSSGMFFARILTNGRELIRVPLEVKQIY